METEDNSITFRLPPEALARLLREARQAGISSKHQYARMLVIHALGGADQPDVTPALTAIEDALAALRQGLRRGVAAILQNVSDLDEKEIHEWISDRLFRDESPGAHGLFSNRADDDDSRE